MGGRQGGWEGGRQTGGVWRLREAEGRDGGEEEAAKRAYWPAKGGMRNPAARRSTPPNSGARAAPCLGRFDV